jgi:arsenate reductase-like glutaredoxin family protein
MLFCGRNKELDEMISRWKLASDISSPSPQLVILKAERGVGKTRLALEFYRWLSENHDVKAAESYWPDSADVMSRGFDVNADPCKCRYDQTMPYLWWGIRAADPGAENPISGDAVASYDRYLAPHLVALVMKSRTLQTGKTLLGVWADVAKSEAASWSGYDTVLSVGEGILKSVQILRGSFDESKVEAVNEFTKKSVSRVNVILEDLESVLQPSSLRFAKTPAVILIDDAQFTSNDPGLADFCEKLLHQSMTQRWPLMIIVTHWKRDLSPDFMKTEKSFAGIYHHAQSGSSNQKGPVVGLPGGYLNELNTIEIDLAPIDDLSRALQSALPGLPSNQVDALMNHAGGNPRHLEQIIAFLKENENLFENFNISKPLTRDGLIEALEETHDIFKVVMRRLRDAPPEVQEAICLASLQGTRFVSDYVNDLAKLFLSSDRADALSKAIDPFCMVTSRQAASISEFTERLFYLVAEKRRHSLKQLQDTDALNAALRKILRERLNSMDVKTVQDIDVALMTLGMASQIFAVSDPSFALNALGLTCQLEQRRYAYPAAVKAADSFFRLLTDSKIGGGIELGATVAVADVLASEGRHVDAYVLVGFYLKMSREQATQNDTPANQRVLTLLLDKLGDIARAAGNVSHASQLWAESLEIRRKLAKCLQTVESQRDLSVSLNRLGDAAMDAGDVAGATQAHEEALLIARDLAMRSQTPLSQNDLWLSLIKVVNVAMFAGNLGKAAKAVLESKDIARKLVDSLQTPESQKNLMKSLNMTGEVLKKSGYLAEAAYVWQEGRDIAYDLAMRMESPESQHDLWVSLNMVGEAAMNVGNVSAAAQAWEEGLGIARELNERVKTTQSLRAVWASLRHVGEALRVAGNTTGAEHALQEGLDIARYLAMRLQTSQSNKDVLNSLDLIGDVAFDQGDVEAAASAWMEGVEIARNLHLKLQTVPSQEDLSLILSKYAKAEIFNGNKSAAALAYKEVIEICKALTDHCPTEKIKEIAIYSYAGLIACNDNYGEAKALLDAAETLAHSLPDSARNLYLAQFSKMRTTLESQAGNAMKDQAVE